MKHSLSMLSALALLSAIVIGCGDDKKPEKEELIFGAKDKDSEKPAGPRLLVNENFKDAFEKKLPIPEGWSEGDAFRVGKDKLGPAYLEISKRGEYYFTKLPPLALSDDFAIECVCILPPPGHTGVMFRLDDGLETPLIGVGVDGYGRITIGTDGTGERERGPASFQDRHWLKPVTITLKRVGAKLSVLLNDEYAAGKDLGKVGKIETVRLGLTTGNTSPRIYRLSVVQGASGEPIPESTKDKKR